METFWFRCFVNLKRHNSHVKIDCSTYVQEILRLSLMLEHVIFLFSQKEAEDSMEVTSMVLVTKVQGNDRTTCGLAMKLETLPSISDSHMSHTIRDISMYLHVIQ